MTPEFINLTEAMDVIIHKLESISACVADVAESYPRRYGEEDTAALAARSKRLEDTIFRFSVHFKVLTDNLTRYGQ